MAFAGEQYATTVLVNNLPASRVGNAWCIRFFFPLSGRIRDGATP